MSQDASFSCMDYSVPTCFEPHVGSLRVCLGQWLTESRQDRLIQVVDKRSRRVLSVFEDTHHSHNVSAVLRTADAFGFQDSFFVYQAQRRASRIKDCVERGSSNWLTLRRAHTVQECGEALRRSGYAVALVTLPSFFITSRFYNARLPAFAASDLEGSRFWDFLGDRRVALVFGNEADGLSEEWLAYADCYCHVGMVGFVESLNLSVTAGILLQSLRVAVEGWRSVDSRDGLTETERMLLLDQWAARSSTNGSCLIQKSAPELVEYYRFILEGGFFRPFGQCG